MHLGGICWYTPYDMDAGTVVDGRYEVCRPLGVTGGMGDVYLCLDHKLNRQVAVKLIKPEHASKTEYRERFQREIDSAIALDGYDVVRIHDCGECAALHAPYYVMEYLRGRDVRSELAACGPFELSRALQILLDVCQVIGAAHARGIVHRDLKPSNLFLEGPPSPRRSVRVLDFGIARVVGDPRDGALTQLSGQPGSPNYMSPEQHKNELQVGVHADIWALGAVLYEMVVGEKAWPGESYEARQRVLEDATPSVRTSRPELPGDLDLVIQKCLEKDPAARYSSVTKLAGDLRELYSDCHDSGATLPTFVSTKQGGTTPRSFVSRWGLAVAVLSVVVIALIGARPWRRQVISPVPGAAEANESARQSHHGNDGVTPPALAEDHGTEPSRPAVSGPSASTPAGVTSAALPHDMKPRSKGMPQNSGKFGRIPAAASALVPAPPTSASTSAPKLYRNETRLKTK